MTDLFTRNTNKFSRLITIAVQIVKFVEHRFFVLGQSLVEPL